MKLTVQQMMVLYDEMNIQYILVKKKKLSIYLCLQ